MSLPAVGGTRETAGSGCVEGLPSAPFICCFQDFPGGYQLQSNRACPGTPSSLAPGLQFLAGHLETLPEAFHLLCHGLPFQLHKDLAS